MRARPAQKKSLLLSTLLTASLAASGCGLSLSDSFSSGAGIPSNGEFGATVGGVKDLNLARELIKSGVVPPSSAFLVEAMFSEHDLPLTGTRCDKELCLRGAAGIAPTLSGQPAAWAQLGMSSTIDPATYQRPSLTAILCVDVSGSMGWEGHARASSYPTPGRLSYLLLKELAARLGPEDRVALVTYGSSVSTALGLTAGNDPRLGSAIEALTTAGSTNMEAGLTRAYELAKTAQGSTKEVRIFLFTDEQPNVGATSDTAFSKMVAAGAQVGSSLTVFGMGVGLQQSLLNAMAHFRGGNGYTLSTEEHVPALMSESWPWLASPLAYDLKVEVTPATGYSLRNSYGFPGAPGSSAKLEATTVFLSRKKGGLLLELAAGAEAPITAMSLAGALSYVRTDGMPVSERLSIDAAGATLDGRGMYFQQPSVGKAVALAILTSAMKEAASLYGIDRTGAIQRMQQAADRIAQDAAALKEPSLDPEVKLAADLLALMKSGARQDLSGTLR